MLIELLEIAMLVYGAWWFRLRLGHRSRVRLPQLEDLFDGPLRVRISLLYCASPNTLFNGILERIFALASLFEEIGQLQAAASTNRHARIM